MPKARDTIPELLRKAADLSTRAAELADGGDIDGALALDREAEALRRRARSTAARRSPRGTASRSSGQTARQDAVASLQELGVPSAPREIADYAEARFGRPLDTRAFASIRRDERRAFDKRSGRPVYIVPALEGRWLLPARGRFALSEWPPEQRLLGPQSLRVDHLKVTLQLVDRFLWIRERDPEQVGALQSLLARYARSVPHALEDEELDPDRVRDAVTAELELLRDEDDLWRSQHAERVRRLPEEQQIWGAEPPRLVEGSG